MQMKGAIYGKNNLYFEYCLNIDIKSDKCYN